MAANISNIQLTVLQLPQVAHDQVPVVQASELASAQVPQLIRREDEQAAESVQQMQSAQGNRIGDATAGEGGASYEPSARERRRQTKASPRPATPHPMGVGSLVDIQI